MGSPPLSLSGTVGQSSRARSLWGDALRRLLHDRLAVLGLIIVVGALVCAIFAPVIAPYPPLSGDLANWYLKPPQPGHPFGTDDLGRDILSRVIYGAQLSLKTSLLAEGLGMIIGTVVGIIAATMGGFIDSLIMRIVDILMAFPLLIIAIALATILGGSDLNLILALSLSIWPFIARLARSQALSLKETEYVAAARLVGARPFAIMFRHILPNMLTPLIVYSTLGAANIILQEAALSFLGLGTTDPSVPSWGKMLSQARSFTLSAPWLSFFPGLAILLAVMGFNLLGDGLRDALDVRSR
ncbi:MAG TPA: ABC transporter permease [Aggregatilineales bacterium]|nr:ABC transporter permease [Aggregatilineales bacterium]